ncbi:MAG: hypothetical protein ACLP9L_09065 [Thermoguttaceae bacterium]
MPPTPAAGASPTETVLPEDLCAAFKSAPDCEGKLAALRQHFELKAISDPADLHAGVLCALRKDAEVYLVEIGPLEDDRRTVGLRLHLSARHAKPAPLSTLLELGRNGSLHRLEPKAPKAESEFINWGAQAIDLGSFTRLISLAQSCGMVPNVDNIGTVRDADFRAGQYLTAFYNIERMYTALNTAAQQRQQQLRREDIAYRSGRLRMSPKEWNQKVARDTAKTQSIDRALNQFRKVMAGLRLRALDAQQAGGQRDSGT